MYHIREPKSLLYKYILWFSLSLHKGKVGLENSYDIHRFRVLQVYPSRIFPWHPIHQNYWNHAHKIETLIWTWFEIFYELSFPELHDLRNSYYTITQFLEFNKTEKPLRLQGCTILKTVMWLLCNCLESDRFRLLYQQQDYQQRHDLPTTRRYQQRHGLPTTRFTNNTTTSTTPTTTTRSNTAFQHAGPGSQVQYHRSVLRHFHRHSQHAAA